MTKEEEEQPQDQDDELSFDISKFSSVIKKDIKNIDRQTVMLGLMVFAVCIVFFFLGYYFGTHNASVECNKIILENQAMGTMLPVGFWG